MLVISSILACFWTAYTIAAFVCMSEYHEGDDLSLLHMERSKWIMPAFVGAVVGLCNYMAPKGGAASASSFVAMLLVFVYLIMSLCRRCDMWIKFATLVVLIIPIHFTFAATTEAASVTTPALMNFIWIPSIAFIGVSLTSLILSKYESTDNEKAQKVYGILRFVVPAIAILLALSMIAKAFDFGKKAVVEETEAAEVVEEVIDSKEPEQWWHFYNTELLKDDDTKNDYNFGPNPLEKLATDKVASGELLLKDIANKTEDELIGLASVEDVENDFRGRIAKDPVLGAGDMAYFDSLTKTRYLGTFYDECKGEWASTINLAKDRWMKDKAAYENTLAAWFAFLDTADKVELVKVTGGLDDQMYMNPYTVDLVPDIIVMETTDHDGYFLRYTFNIKGEEIKVAYRVNCGYQPTNVSKVMNIKAQKNPNKPEEPKPKKQETPSGGGKSITPNNTAPVVAPAPMLTPDVNPAPNPTPGPTPGPDPDITNPKDPTKGPDAGDNNSSGPGSDTNSGVGARYSQIQDDTGSTFIEIYNDLKEEVNELVDINDGSASRPAGDSNTPTEKSSKSDTVVDSNAEKGTGNGGADVGHKVDSSVTGVDQSTGTADTVKGEVGGAEGSWGGPPL